MIPELIHKDFIKCYHYQEQAFLTFSWTSFPLLSEHHIFQNLVVAKLLGNLVPFSPNIYGYFILISHRKIR